MSPTTIVVPFDNGDVIHVRCWGVGETEKRCRESRTLIQKSQKLIDESGRVFDDAIEHQGRNLEPAERRHAHPEDPASATADLPVATD